MVITIATGGADNAVSSFLLVTDAILSQALPAVVKHVCVVETWGGSVVFLMAGDAGDGLLCQFPV